MPSKMNRQELVENIRAAATHAAAIAGVVLGPDALDALSSIPNDVSDTEFNIDVTELEEAIRHVIAAAADVHRDNIQRSFTANPGPLTAGTIEGGLRLSECHYLWFC